jgi:hypothetical protein
MGQATALAYNHGQPRPSPRHGCSLPFDDWEPPSDLNGASAGCWERAAWPCGALPPDPARKAAQQRLAYLIQPQNDYCAKVGRAAGPAGGDRGRRARVRARPDRPVG